MSLMHNEVRLQAGTFSLDTVTHLAVNLLLSPQEPPLKLLPGLHYARRVPTSRVCIARAGPADFTRLRR